MCIDKVNTYFKNELYYSIIDLYDVQLKHKFALTLFVSFYNGSNKINSMWIIHNDKNPTKPTAKDLEDIINYYNNY